MAPPIGFWGERTSTIDWCEENYAVSFYVAEFWNTLSNAVIIVAPLLMLGLGLKQKHEKRFIYTFTIMAVIGIGSTLFHMTLQYNMQLMDELPMLWASACFIYTALMMKSKKNEDSKALQIVLFVLCSVITLIYILVEAPIFLQVTYGLMSVFVILAHLKMVLTMECEKRFFMLGLAFYLLGFLFWNVDNLFCHHLRSIRTHKLSNSSGMLLQCHAWWHIFTGIGVYLGILFSFHTRYTFLQRNPQIKQFLGCWSYVTLSSTSGGRKY